MNSQLAGLAKARREAKRDSTLVKQESTEQLLMEKDEEIKKSVTEYSDLKNNLTSKDVDPMDLQECLVNPAVDRLASIKKEEISCAQSEDTQLLKTLRAENASLAEAVKALNREKADMHQF